MYWLVSATYNTGQTLTIDKSLNVIGAGTTSSIITGNNANVIDIRAGAPSVIRVSGFGITGTGDYNVIEQALIYIRGILNGTIFNSVRIDHMKFYDCSGHVIYVGDWWIYRMIQKFY